MPENICIIGWYQYDWLNKHILESIKKSKSNVKQKITRIFESKIVTHQQTINQKELQMPLKVDMLNTKVGRMKKYQ